MTITTRLYTAVFGKEVGSDQFGNRYFTLKKEPKTGKAKRWVMYNGLAEPSKVPAEWHGWLHYTHHDPIGQNDGKKYNWIKSHVPNLTGTKNAYVPPGHLLRGSQRDKTTSDYSPWKPE